MRVYYEVKNNLPINSDIQKAIDGFEFLGFDLFQFSKHELLMAQDKWFPYFSRNIFVASIDTTQLIFNILKKYPQDIDYPNFLFEQNLLSRKIDVSTVDLFKRDYAGEKCFVKPVKTKSFDGLPIHSKEHLKFLDSVPDQCVYVSEHIDIISEWRCYVQNSKLIHTSNYSGDFKIAPDYRYVEKLIELYTDSPCCYTIDVCITKDGITDVVEFNDFWAIGSYGLNAEVYANMLKQRYLEIVRS